MDPKLLYQLAEVIELGSMSRAAVELNVTQPTLTRNIRIIEEHIGAPVLHRGRHGVTPTEIGDRLYIHGQRIRQSLQEADSTLLEWRADLEGEVKVGFGLLIAATLMPKFFCRLDTQQLNYAIRSCTLADKSMAKEMEQGVLDIAISRARHYEHTDNLMYETIMRDELCVVAGSRSPLLKIEGPIEPSLLLDQPWIAFGSPTFKRGPHHAAMKALGLEGVVPKIAYSGDSMMPVVMLGCSDSLAVLPKKMARSIYAENSAKPLEIAAELPEVDAKMFLSTITADRPSVQDLSNRIREFFKAFDENQTVAEETNSALSKIVTDIC